MKYLKEAAPIRLNPDKSKGNNHRVIKSIYPDRRSGKDRRKSYSIDYFLQGGVERRSWKERRYLWYMTE